MARHYASGDDLYYNRVPLEKTVEIIQTTAYEDWSKKISDLHKQQRVHSESRHIHEVIRVQIESHAYKMSREILNLIEKEAEQIVKVCSSSFGNTEVEELLRCLLKYDTVSSCYLY